MPLDLCDPRTVWLSVAGLAAYALLEFWLGRTKLTRSNSLVELLLTVAVISALWVWETFLKRKKP